MQEITLYRRHHRRWVRVALIGGLVAVAAALVTAALIVPGLIRYGPNDLPRVVGEDSIDPLASAQERFAVANGRYASSLDELDRDPDAQFRRKLDIIYRVTASGDGAAYIAGAVGFTGRYAAIIRAEGAEQRGEGDTFLDALRAAGWTPQWADEHGFDPLSATEHVYGAIDVREGKVRELRRDEATSLYSVSSRPVPVAASGTTWVEATVAAGGDPAEFTVEGEIGASPREFTSASGDRLTVAATRDGVEVRIDAAARVTGPALLSSAVIDAAGTPELAEHANESFRCTTASSASGVHSVTLCQDLQGRLIVWATTGKASSNPVPADALDEVGATSEWGRNHGITLPRLDDLL